MSRGIAVIQRRGAENPHSAEEFRRKTEIVNAYFFLCDFLRALCLRGKSIRHRVRRPAP